MKTDVYSWRLSADRKAALTEIAEREGTTIAHLLEQATDGLLQARDSVDETEQSRLRARALKHVGVLKTGGPAASTRVRDVVRERLEEKRRQGRL